MSDEKIRGFCKDCDKYVVVFRSRPNHVLHLILSLLTIGFWILVWIGLSIKIGGWRCTECGSNRITHTTSTLSIVLLTILAIFFVLPAFVGIGKYLVDKNSTLTSQTSQMLQSTKTQPVESKTIERPIEKTKENPIDALAKAIPSDLNPYGELAEIFSMGSTNTDLQRENKLKEITGKVIQWKLPVYEVSKSGDNYKIQTSGSVKLGAYSNSLPVGTFIKITARNENEVQFIEMLKTGDTISFKGIIKDTTMRNLDIEPAILVLNSDIDVSESASIQTEPKQESVVEQTNDRRYQTEVKTKQTDNTDQNKSWVGDWGSGIIAIVSNKPCQHSELSSQGYNNLMTVSIPIARLKKPSDAWQINGDRAITVMGCWFQKSGDLIHAKIINKKNGKTTEQDFNMAERIWTVE